MNRKLTCISFNIPFGIWTCLYRTMFLKYVLVFAFWRKQLRIHFTNYHQRSRKIWGSVMANWTLSWTLMAWSHRRTGPPGPGTQWHLWFVICHQAYYSIHYFIQCILVLPPVSKIGATNALSYHYSHHIYFFHTYCLELTHLVLQVPDELKCHLQKKKNEILHLT